MTQHSSRQKPFPRELSLSFPAMPLRPLGDGSEAARPLEDARSDSAQLVFRTLVVPLDGTQHAEHALPYALAIARRSRARIRLVRVHPRMDQFEPWHMCSVHEWNSREKREAYDYLVDVAIRIARVSSVTVDVRLIDSTDAVEGLAKQSARADLVVMASRRRGFLRRLFSPSVANALRRRIRTPGLFVQGYPYPVDLTGDPIARRIVVPLNETGFAERILRVATAVSRLKGAPISLVNVQNHDWSRGASEHTTPTGYLTRIADDVRRDGSPVNAHVITTKQSIAAAVASFAKQRKVDVIAVATRSDGDWAQVVQGDMVDSLIRQTNLPLLVLGVDSRRKRAEATTIVEL